MTFIVPEDIERYAEAHTIEGRFLEVIVYMTGARRILELGTFSGYSAISMAAALPPDGRIDTCEVEEEHAAVARRYIEEAGYADRISIHMGPALASIGRLEGEFDFVFIDADKENYVNYYEAVLPRLSDRGLIAADNTLWSGRVIDEAEHDESTNAVRAFNDHVRDDDRVACVMLSIRDGVTLIRRTG